MLRPSSSVLLSVLGLSLASFTFACSGASTDNADVDSSQMAIQKKKDGKPTGDGKTCSWGNISVPVPVAPPVSPVEPSPGGSSGGCATDADGSYRCWSYDSNGKEVPGGSIGGSSSGWSSSSGGSSGSSGSSGGCTTDEKGNTECWTYPSEPEPTPPVMPTPLEPTYQIGDWFPSALDSCNKCTCTESGIMCTVQACAEPPPPPPPPGCFFAGKPIEPGTSYNDGCNTCSCGKDGQVFCTEMACPIPPPPPPSKGCVIEGKDVPAGDYKDGCNTCTCTKDGQLLCTKMACDPPVSPKPPVPKK